MTKHLPLILLLLIAAAPTTKPTDRFESYAERIPHTTVKFDMLAVPAGKIRFALDAKSPAREVQIRRFWMAKTECTWDEYMVWMHRLDLAAQERTEFFKTHPSKLHPRNPYLTFPEGYGRPGYPAIKISSEAAKAYCEWLSKLTGRKYRLPTEPEWEYVCRTGGEVIHFDKGGIMEMAWCEENSAEGNEEGDPVPHPVAHKKPNAWGVNDMLGNVGEWCITTAGRSAVLRGGSYLSKANELHCALRIPFHPDWQMTDPSDPKNKWWLTDAPFAGFRLVREE